MTLERGIRARQWKPYPLGYQAASTASTNEGDPLLDTSQREANADVEIFGEALTPLSLTLRATLEAEEIENQSIQAQLIIDDKVFTSTNLYSLRPTHPQADVIANSRYKAIKIMYAGYGVAHYDNSTAPVPIYGEKCKSYSLRFAEPNLIYRKPFSYQKASPVIEKRTYISPGVWRMDPAGQENARILRPYGGYFKQGVSIETLSQSYFSIDYILGNTRVEIHSTESLRQQYITPPYDQILGETRMVFFMPPTKEESLSLSQAIYGGYPLVDLISGINEVGAAHGAAYQAIDFQERGPGLLDITFIPLV